MRLLWLISALMLALPLHALARGGVTISEWQVPWPDTRPRDPYAGNPARVRFVGQTGNYLAWLKSENRRVPAT